MRISQSQTGSERTQSQSSVQSSELTTCMNTTPCVQYELNRTHHSSTSEVSLNERNRVSGRNHVDSKALNHKTEPLGVARARAKL